MAEPPGAAGLCFITAGLRLRRAGGWLVRPPCDSPTFPLSVSTFHPCPAGTLRENKESLCNLFII